MGNVKVFQVHSGYAIVDEQYWNKYGKYAYIEQWLESINAARYNRGSLESCDRRAYVIVDCNNKYKIVDAQNIMEEDKFVGKTFKSDKFVIKVLKKLDKDFGEQIYLINWNGNEKRISEGGLKLAIKHNNLVSDTMFKVGINDMQGKLINKYIKMNNGQPMFAQLVENRNGLTFVSDEPKDDKDFRANSVDIAEKHILGLGYKRINDKSIKIADGPKEGYFDIQEFKKGDEIRINYKWGKVTAAHNPSGTRDIHMAIDFGGNSKGFTFYADYDVVYGRLYNSPNAKPHRYDSASVKAKDKGEYEYATKLLRYDGDIDYTEVVFDMKGDWAYVHDMESNRIYKINTQTRKRVFVGFNDAKTVNKKINDSPMTNVKVLKKQKSDMGKTYYLLEGNWGSDGNKWYVLTSDRDYHGENTYNGPGDYHPNLKVIETSFEHWLLMDKLEKKYGKEEGRKRYLAGKNDKVTVKDYGYVYGLWSPSLKQWVRHDSQIIGNSVKIIFTNNVQEAKTYYSSSGVVKSRDIYNNHLYKSNHIGDLAIKTLTSYDLNGYKKNSDSAIKDAGSTHSISWDKRAIYGTMYGDLDKSVKFNEKMYIENLQGRGSWISAKEIKRAVESGEAKISDSAIKDAGEYIIYKENGDIKGTDAENYSARIRNANKIQNFTKQGFKSAEQAKAYMEKYGGGAKVVIKDGYTKTYVPDLKVGDVILVGDDKGKIVQLKPNSDSYLITVELSGTNGQKKTYGYNNPQRRFVYVEDAEKKAWQVTYQSGANYPSMIVVAKTEKEAKEKVKAKTNKNILEANEIDFERATKLGIDIGDSCEAKDVSLIKAEDLPVGKKITYEGAEYEIVGVWGVEGKPDKVQIILSNNKKDLFLVVSKNRGFASVHDSLSVKDSVSRVDCINAIKNNTMEKYQRSFGETVYEFGDKDKGYYMQIQDVGKSTLERIGEKWHEKESSYAWGRIWYDGKILFKQDGPRNIVKQKMILFLQMQTKDKKSVNDANKLAKCIYFETSENVPTQGNFNGFGSEGIYSLGNNDYIYMTEATKTGLMHGHLQSKIKQYNPTNEVPFSVSASISDPNKLADDLNLGALPSKHKGNITAKAQKYIKDSKTFKIKLNGKPYSVKANDKAEAVQKILKHKN